VKEQKDKKYLSQEDPLIKDLIFTHLSSAKSILDVGCGGGGNMRMLKNAGFLCEGITISESERVEAEQFGKVMLYNLEQGLPVELQNKFFDIFIASHVMEHIFYPEKLLKDLNQSIALGGVFIIPNLLFWRNRLKLFFGIWQYTDTGLMDYTHSRWYSYKSIKKLLAASGFNIRYTRATGGIFFGRGPRLLQFIDQTLLKLFPGLMGFQFYIVVAKS
jgi:2-polyprenyl-3-methyl-5-hydroxy-6-metoxy-1,4-benzoquinol methylase